MKLFLSICITILFSNCVVLSPAEQANVSQTENSSTKESAISIAETQFNWKEVAEGIMHCSFFDETSHSLCNAVKINLDTPNINLISSRPIEEAADGGTSIFRAETTKKFAQRNGAIVAVNATPFNYPSGRASKKRTIAGVYAINDKILAPQAGRYAALIFEADDNEKLTASILDTQNDFEPNSSTRFAFGGFWTILRDGEIIMFKSKQKEPRTAAGILDNGKTLILLAIDKSGSTSKGATFNETSSILLKLGAQEAIMLDGGSSSSLIINGRQISKTFPHVEVALSFGFLLNE